MKNLTTFLFWLAFIGASSIVFGQNKKTSKPVGEASTFTFKSRFRDIDHAVDSLLKIMTIEEKVGQLNLLTSDLDQTGASLRPQYRKDIEAGLVGAVFNAYGVDYVRKLQDISMKNTRLKIPLLFGYDVIHGHKTIFPMPLAMASSWDLARIEGAQRIAWQMNFPLRGWNETMITYVMAATSRTHGIPRSVYDNGYCTSDWYLNGRSYYGITLPLGPDGGKGGPLFFTHYSFLGLNPTNLRDSRAQYFAQNLAHTQINYQYCVRNPRGYPLYSPACWGLTASDNDRGYSAHDPDNDLSIISPTAALSCMPYTPTESMQALKFFYYKMGDKLWGPHGFYDAFNTSNGWVADSYLAIDQGPIIIMIENYRTQRLWNLFMSAPEVQTGLTNLGFTY